MASAADIAVSIEIDATPDEVWQVLEPVERHTEWMMDAESIEFVTDQRRGVGTEFVCVTKVGPITLNDVMTVTAWEPGVRMGVRHDGVVSGSGNFFLDPIDLGRRTRMRWEESLSFPWYLGGPLGELVGGRLVLAAIWRRNLRTLKQLVEQVS